MKFIKTFALVVMVLLFVIFAIQNFESVTITLFIWSIKLPLVITAIVIYVLGMLTGGILKSGLKKLGNLEKKE